MCALVIVLCYPCTHTRIQNIPFTHTKPTAETTGLDPIFFMHHSNIDFIFALYRAFKPDVALEDGQFMDGTFLVPPSMDDNYVGSFSDMSPFYKNPSRRQNFYKVLFLSPFFPFFIAIPIPSLLVSLQHSHSFYPFPFLLSLHHPLSLQKSLWCLPETPPSSDILSLILIPPSPSHRPTQGQGRRQLLQV